MLYTIENHLDTVPVIASFSRDGQVIPLYVQLDSESIRVSCRSSQKFIDYSVSRNCVEQFIGSPRAKSIFSGGVSNGSQRENQNPSAEL